MLIYQEFLAENTVNELAAFSPNERLRFAVHEIVGRLKNNGEIKFPELCKILKNEFKIDISVDLIKEIFDRWDKFNDPDYSIFQKDDKNWMDVFPFGGYVKKKMRDKQSFGKHRNKATTPVTYSRGGYYDNEYSMYPPQNGSWIGGRWVPKGSRTDVNPLYGGEYYGD
jgi:hypothetical protein